MIENNNSLESLFVEFIKFVVVVVVLCRWLSEIFECINEDKDYCIIIEGRDLIIFFI